MSLIALLAANFAVALVAMLLLWLIALRLRDVSMIDSFWAFGMVIIAANSFLLTDGHPLRKLMLTGLCAAWGLRLGVHLLIRWRRLGPDPRYVKILGAAQARGWSFAKASLLLVFLTQAPLLFLVCLPVQLGQIAADPAPGVIAWTGAAIAAFGIAFETISDAQLDRFRADPASQGRVLDTGLWRYTRHPNYFGDACTWWGLYLIAAETMPGLWALPGPLFLTFTLVRWSGAALLERGLKKSRPDYADYVRRTSGFIPLPPKS